MADGLDSDNLGLRLFDAFKKVQRKGAHFRPSEDLRPSKFHILLSLHWLQQHEAGAPRDGATVSELSSRARVSMPGVSQVLRALQDKGLVERAFNREDRRVVYVSLTKDGKAFLEDSQQHFQAFLNDIADKMGAEDCETLIRLLKKLGDVLNDVSPEGKK